MIDGALWALAVECVNGDGSGTWAFVAATFCAAFGAVWLGGRGDSDDLELETSERTESAYRALAELVAAFVAGRNRRDETVEPTDESERGTSLDDENGKRDESGPDGSVGGENETAGTTPDDGDGLGTLNAVDFWREDYWNFDFGLDDPSEETEDPDAWKKDGEKGQNREENGKKSPGSSAASNENSDERRRGGNYFGAFFQRRNRLDAESDAAEGREERSARWKRPKKDENEGGASSENGGNNGNSENSGGGEKGRNAENGEERDGAGENVFFETDDRAPWDDSSAETDDELWAEDDSLWSDEPDYAFLDDETKSDDEKIAYLRRRIDEGDDEAREELARLLVQTAAEAGRADAEKAFAALDEAEALVAEAENENDGADDERRELLGQILLQRPYFYLRNDMTPPIASANAALSRIRSWADDASGPDARRLLATAWQIQGNCLAALGSSVAALASLQTARTIFEELVGEGATDVEPSLAYVAASIGDAYAAIGDLPPAISSFREALATLGKFEQEPFLAEKVNVLFRLSSALRTGGDAAGAEEALREAVDVEERLLAIDEEDYFAPYAQLLTAQAELLLSRGAYEDASAALDQAISTLKIYLTADVALSRRVFAYSLLDDALRKRAIARMRAGRFCLAARDVEEALEYLTLATKKGENFDPTRRVLETCALIFDLGVARDEWAFVAETQELVERFVDALAPEERRRAIPTYSQLLLQRHVALGKANRFDEAAAATDKAIAALEAELVDADADAENDLRLILAKARFQRAVYRAEALDEPLEALDEFGAAIEIYEEARRGDELDETSAAFYLEAVCRRATIRARAGLPDASNGVRGAVRQAAAFLRRGRWRFLDETANLSRTTVFCALADEDETTALRVARIWLRYFRRLRRRYVETCWTLDDAGGVEKTQKRCENIETLEKIEAACVDLRRFRVGIVENREWTAEEARFLDLDVEPFLGRRLLDLENGENSEVGEGERGAEVAPNAASSEDKKDGEDGGNSETGEIANIAEENRLARGWRRWFRRLTKDSGSAQNGNLEKKGESGKNEKNAEKGKTTQVGENGENREDGEDAPRVSAIDVDRLRARFVASTADDPKALALFVDLLACARAVERRLITGDWNMASPLSWALDKLTDLYFEKGALELAAKETVVESRRLRGLEAPNDAEILTNWSAFWQLQAATLRLAERRAEERGAEKNAVEKDEKNDGKNDGDSIKTGSFDGEIERAFRAAFDASRRASETDDPSAALAKMRLGEIGAAYLHWLTSRSRGDEGWAFLTETGAALEARSDGEKPLDLFALGGFYSAIGAAAEESGRPEAVAAFEKVGEFLRREGALVGETPEVLARRAAVRRRLGMLAEARNDKTAASEFYWDSLEDARRNLEENGFDCGVFAIFASLVLFFLREEPTGRGRAAARFARRLEESAEKNWDAEARESAELGFWYINSTAALSSFQTNGAFFVARERFERADAALRRSSALAETVEETAPEVKFAEGLFWLRRGFAARGRDALNEAIAGWARLDGNDPKRPSPDALTAQAFVAASLTEEKRFGEARRIFETIYPLAERRALEAATLLKNGDKIEAKGNVGGLDKSGGSGKLDALGDLANGGESVAFRLATAREFLKAYCVLGDFFGMLAAEEGRFDAAFRIFSIFRKLARKMRGSLGKDDATEKNVWHFWAEAALRAKKYRVAIAAATRSLAGRRVEDENDVALFCEASRIRATARLERNGLGDRRAAANDVERSLDAMRGEFRAGRFFLRTEFAETLLLRARLAAARGDVDGARTDAERARRLLETSARRGLERCRRLLEEDVAKVFAELEKNCGA